MYLGNPLLPINFTVGSAADSIKKELQKKYWHEFEQKPLRLNLVPYFLFNYHYFLEADASGKKTIKKSFHGVLAIDGHDISVREDLVELLKSNWKRSSPVVPKTEFKEKWNNIEKREQDAVLALKVAEHFGVPKENVVISSARKMLVPFYLTSVVLDKKEYKLVVNAIDGEIDGIDEIPMREKGYLEITRETIKELKDPKNWLKYSKDAIFEGAASASSRAKQIKLDLPKEKAKGRLAVFESRVILALIIVLALILIIFSFFRIRFP